MPAASASTPSIPFRSRFRSGYPYRTLIALATILAMSVALAVLPVGAERAWCLAGAVLALGATLIALRTFSFRHQIEQDPAVHAALTRSIASLPESLRTQMPVVLITGDGLEAIFNRNTDHDGLAHVGEEAIWLRVDNPQSLPQFNVAMRRWRDGRAPDGVVVTIAPALYPDEDALTQRIRLIRQSLSDAAHMLGTRLPMYLAVYQRLTACASKPDASPGWYGVSSATPIINASQFESVVCGAERLARRADADRSVVWQAAGLSALVDWTQRVVIEPLHDRLQPAAPCSLYGAGWMDCGPADPSGSGWTAALQARTQLTPPFLHASPAPWPLPQALIQALPRQLWSASRPRALAHALAITGCAATVAVWSAGQNNRSQLVQVGSDLTRFSMIPATRDAARRDALNALIADRDRLQEYQRSGVPLRLSFGMYRGAALIPALNHAIASYQPPPPPPVAVTLDSMSLFDTGRAQLKPGATRAMVSALEMIKVHPDKRILIAVYTDNAGVPDRNRKLSVARAGAVRDWLVKASGLPVTRFAIQGYGDTRPIAANNSTEGRAQNRRVKITPIPDRPDASGR